MPPSSSTIAILGAGSVGSAIAQTLLLRRVVADLILVDIDHELCQAQVQDLSDATHLSNVRIRQGSHADAGQADIIILTAGAKQRPGDTRLDLIDRNLKVLGSVLEAMNPIRPDAILLLIANPVDALTYFAQKMSGLPKNQVLGSGTLLDSIRLRGILADKLQVSDRLGILAVDLPHPDLHNRLPILQSMHM
jgi:L-lactate dehydrogenase